MTRRKTVYLTPRMCWLNPHRWQPTESPDLPAVMTVAVCRNCGWRKITSETSDATLIRYALPEETES